jgi:hypothetical protein
VTQRRQQNHQNVERSYPKAKRQLRPYEFSQVAEFISDCLSPDEVIGLEAHTIAFQGKSVLHGNRLSQSGVDFLNNCC